jgi:hypothetical protein
MLKTEIPGGRKFAEFATFAMLFPQNQNCEREAKALVQSRSTHPPSRQVIASAEDARSSVERLLNTMAAENEGRRDWWRAPVEGCSEGRLAIRSIVTGETTVIYLATKRGSA